MARIRTLKPELPQDRKLAGVTRDARLTFIYLITAADDDGLVRAEGRYLLGTLFPFDSDVTEEAIRSWIDELAAIDVVRWRSTQDGASVLELVNWSRHQHIRNRSKPFLKLQLVNGSKPAPAAQPVLLESSAMVKEAPNDNPSRQSWRGFAAKTLRDSGVVESHIADAIANFWATARRRFNDEQIAAVVRAHGKRFMAEGQTWHPGRVWNPRNPDFDDRFLYAIHQQTKKDEASARNSQVTGTGIRDILGTAPAKA